MSRAIVSGIKLTRQDVAIVKGMLHRGDRQHDIASWFGVNGGRIAEISTRAKFSDVLMQTDRLPPVGPYLSGKQSTDAKIALLDLQIDLKNLKGEVLSERTISRIRIIEENLEKILARL